MRNHPCFVLACLAGALVLLAGCATPETGPADKSIVIPDEPETARKPAGGSTADGPVRSQVEPIAGARLNPLEPSTATIRYVEGARQGKTARMTTKAAEGETWKQMVESIRTMILQSNEGRIILAGEEDADENVAITYDPPIVLLPAKVAAGHRHEGRSMMTVNHLKTGKERDKGPCHYTVELLGMQTIATPAGPIDAYLFRTVREINLSLARVKVTIHTAHAPDRGIIMTRVEQNTRAIGFISMNKKEEWRLAR